MARYGADIRSLSTALSRGHELSDDPSQDIVILLALAYAAAERLREAGVDLTHRGKPLLPDSIERAYREALHVRSTRVPKDLLRTDKISRLGRVNAKT